MLKIERLLVGVYQMNCYIVEHEGTGECLVVDPGADAPLVIQHLGTRRPLAVLLTHGHYDHIGGADGLCEHYGIPLYVGQEDAAMLTDPDLNVSLLFGDTPVIVRTEPQFLGDRFLLGGETITVLPSPGHTEGGRCFLLPDGQGVLCGDTLFNHGYGRTDLPGGDFHKLRESLRMLYHLSPKQPTYPGHGDSCFTGHASAGADA